MTLLALDPDACPSCGAQALKWAVRGIVDGKPVVVVSCRECDWHVTREVRP